MTCSLLGMPKSAKEGEMRGAVPNSGCVSESHVPCLQERVDTGTPLFCPVVVASKGSSLNHSA